MLKYVYFKLLRDHCYREFYCCFMSVSVGEKIKRQYNLNPDIVEFIYKMIKH